MDAASADALFARGQMAYSLAFHIVFASIGIAMPLLMVIAEVLWLRTRDEAYLRLAKQWSKGTAVLFAVGAVSGTVLAFELGLLFPEFMRRAGAVIGMPFALEGFAFFAEAIFLGAYLYGWDRLSPRAHVLCGAVVALSGLASAAFVTLANAWMNAPTGFRVEGGELVDIDPLQAMASPFAVHEIVHGALAAYLATTMAVAGLHAWRLLRGVRSSLHRRALAIATAVTLPAALLQPLIGHVAGQRVAEHQPLKLAAMERLATTQAAAPIRVGPIEVPGALSWLAHGDPSAVVVGLDRFPREDWPHPLVHWCFQGMVALGGAAALYALVTLVLWLRRRRLPDARWWLAATVALGPAGALAMEAGWIVTEVGRQPWTIYGVLRTSQAVTPVGGMALPFAVFALVYLGLGAVVAVVLGRQVRAAEGAA